MNIRDAILKAADHIESNPMRFNFHSVEVPGDGSCGSPGCAIGWISHFLGFRVGADGLTGYSRAWLGAQEALGLNADSIFYARMSAFNEKWRDGAAECAAALRLYADKYHPAEATKQIPQELGSWAAIGWKPSVRA